MNPALTDIPPTGAARASVVVPTTLGPVSIIGLLEEEDDAGRSTVCINKTTDQAGIASAYQDFVRRPTGLVHRLFGKPPFPVFRMDVSASIEAGSSWQLAVLIAHALRADHDRLEENPDTAADLVWATGTVSPVDYAVGGVGHVAEKLRNSRAMFEEAIAARRTVHLFVPTDNLADIDPDIGRWLEARGIAVRAVGAIDDVFLHLSLRPIARAASRPPAPQPSWAGNPYRGLESFHREHRAIFFGRAKAREEALEMLRTAAGHGRPFLLVHGQSGAGKSSLVQAGLVGDVEERAYEGGGFSTAVVSPSAGGENPETSIVAGLRAILGDPAGEEPADSRACAMALVARLRGTAPRGRRSGLLVVDQLEELFEPSIATERVVAFGELLADVVASGVVWVIATIRSDALGLIDRAPALATLARSERVYRLDRPSRMELAEIISAPAALAGRTFADREIPERFADIAARSPDSLPLLQTVLYRFYEQADPQGRLTSEGLKRIGGFEGAVGRWADEALQHVEAAGVGDDLFDRVLVSLVRIDPETRAGMARSLSFDPATPEGRLLAQLADSRLVSIFAGTSTPLARLAHETLITHWPRLATLVERLSSAIALRDDLEQRASRWLGAGEDSAELLRGAARLEAAKEFLDKALVPVAPDVARFVGRSNETAVEERLKAEQLAAAELDKALLERDAATQRARAARRLQMFIGAAAIVCAGVAGIAIHQYSRASQAEQIAAAEAETSRQQTRAARISQARLVSSIATRMKADDPERAHAMLLDVIPDGEADADRPRVREAVDALLAVTQDDRARIIVSRDAAATASTFSPDGSSVATVYQDGRLRIWSVATGASIHRRAAHEASVVDVEFSSNGQFLITTSFDGSIRIWDAAEGKTLYEPPAHGGSVYTGAFSRNATHALTVSDGIVRIWNMADGSLVKEFGGADAHPVAAAFSPAKDDEVLVTYKDGGVRLMEATTGRELRSFEGHTDRVSDVEFSADGARAATLSRDRTIRVWDVGTGEMLHKVTSINERYPHFFVTLNSDGTMVAAGEPDGVTRIWDVETGRHILELRDPPAFARRAAFSPDGKALLTLSGDRTVRLWQVASGTGPRTLHGHTDTISTARFSPDGRFIATSGFDGAARIWQVSSDEAVAVMEGHLGNIYSARFDRSGTRIVSASRDRTARIWDAASGQLLHTLGPHGAEVNGASFSGDGAQVLTYSNDGYARIWDAETGVLLHQLDHNGVNIRFGAFGPDGTRLVTVAMDGFVSVWDITSRTVVQKLPFPMPRGGLGLWSIALAANTGSMAVASEKSAWIIFPDRQVDLVGHTGSIASISYSGDFDRVITASADGTVRVWDSETGRQLLVLSGHDDGVTGAAMSADGALIATGANDGAIRIWDASTGTLLQTFNGHLSSVLFVSFSPDGSRLLSSGTDHTVRTWRIGPKPDVEAMIGRERLAAFATLSEEERRSLDGESVSSPEPFAGDPCDRLAAQPFDPGAPAGAGVYFEQIDVEPALEACEAAVLREPSTLRFAYQLGRALSRAERDEEAAARFKEASDGGYAMATHSLALAYRDGKGLEQDEARARALFALALDRSISVSASSLALLYWNGQGGAQDRPAAIDLWKRGAALGDPGSYDRLGWVAEVGRDGSTPNLEDALMHYAKAVKLANAADKSFLEGARARRASLARILDPQIVSKVWKELEK